MTILDIWNLFLQYGVAAGFLGVATYMLFSGKVVNGDVARIARESEVAELKDAHKSHVDMLLQRYDEMQKAWQDRFAEISEDRNFYRNMSFTLANQLEQSLTASEVATGVAPAPFDNTRRPGRNG